ncbi:MAG TPA: L-threonylcarbamoyladenylate synthase [Spirochaetota bacterium]|nr:L-threonylcarbamoyladenylate synthase [Spirochaetota bacterium]
MTNVVQASEVNIERAAGILRSGGIVAFPTETVYGLGADALNPVACARIFEAKNRPSFDPLIVHIARLEDLEALAVAVPLRARALIERFWPGPLTLVLEKKEIVPDIVTAGLPTVAVRMPAHPVALELIVRTGRPIAAPSANPFGYISPTIAGHVVAQIGDSVDMILDGGQCAVGLESTILRIDEERAFLLRPGGLAIEEIENLIGRVDDASGPNAIPQAPGQTTSHYSPRTPVRIVADAAVAGGVAGSAGLLAFRRPRDVLAYDHVEVLSPSGDLREAAARLFSCLHELDARGLDIIIAESVPENGLGRAIMNRLRRAESAARKR